MPGKRSKARVPLLEKSLAITLVALQGREVMIECKNDAEIAGVIDSSGHGMDVVLTDVKMINPNGNTIETDIMYVLGSTIRYIHLPPDINITTYINDYVRDKERTRYKTRSRNPRLVDKRK